LTSRIIEYKRISPNYVNYCLILFDVIIESFVSYLTTKSIRTSGFERMLLQRVNSENVIHRDIIPHYYISLSSYFRLTLVTFYVLQKLLPYWLSPKWHVRGCTLQHELQTILVSWFSLYILGISRNWRKQR